MAIHDVGSGDNRDNPEPNTHDRPKDNIHTAMPFTHNTGTTAIIRQAYSGVVKVINDGSPLTTTSFSHGLYFTPIVLISLDNASESIAGGTATGVKLPGPFFTSASIGGVTAGVVTFATWVYGFADATNVYINFLNATGTATTVNVTYYLLQQAAG